VDFMFIDWETPNRVLKQGADQLRAIMEEQRGEKPSQDYYKLGVSAWRTLFVTNELNEI
jgi:meckelin